MDGYVAEGLRLLAKQEREMARCPEDTRPALRDTHNAELNALRGRHGLSTDRFNTPYVPR